MKRYVFTTIAVLILICVIQTTGICEGYEQFFVYEDNGDGSCTITSVYDDNLPDNVDVPGKIDGLIVKAIDSYAFASEDYSRRFNVNLPNTLTDINDFAFTYSQVRTVVIPASVEKISSSAFAYCSRLEAINVDPSNTTYASVQGALYNKAEKTLMAYVPGAKVPQGIVRIGDYACSSRTLDNIDVFETTVREIGAYAFADAQITVKKLSSTGSKRTVYVDLMNGYRDYKGYWADLLGEFITDIEDYAFQNANINARTDDYADVDLYLYPHSVQRLGVGVFQDMICSIGKGDVSHNRVLLGEGITEYSDDVFHNIMGSGEYTELVMPNNIARIGSNALCFELENSVNSSNNYRLSNNNTPVVITSENKGTIKIDRLERNAAYNAKFDVPLLLGSMDDSCLCNCTADIITIQPGVTVIPNYAFYGTKTSHFSAPDSLERIEECAFERVSVLPNIDLSHTQVRFIGRRAFAGSSLSKIVLPDALSSIESETFNGCHALSTLTVPDSVESIGDYSFSSSAIANIRLPDNLKSIGEFAFQGCADLLKISIPMGVSEIGDYAFDRGGVVLEVKSDSYAQHWAQENGIPIVFSGGEDLSWLGYDYATQSGEAPVSEVETQIPDYWDDPEGLLQFLSEASYNELCAFLEACEEQKVDLWAIIKNAYNALDGDLSAIEQRFDFESVDLLQNEALLFWKLNEYMLLIGGSDTPRDAELMAKGLAGRDDRDRTFACGKTYISVTDSRR